MNSLYYFKLYLPNKNVLTFVLSVWMVHDHYLGCVSVPDTKSSEKQIFIFCFMYHVLCRIRLLYLLPISGSVDLLHEGFVHGKYRGGGLFRRIGGLKNFVQYTISDFRCQ
jgi:hypothetical protein